MHNIKLNSLLLQSYFYNDDNFNFNYAQAKATAGNFKEAEEVRQKREKIERNEDALNFIPLSE